VNQAAWVPLVNLQPRCAHRGHERTPSAGLEACVGNASTGC
jgi:hypothetical protein